MNKKDPHQGIFLIILKDYRERERKSRQPISKESGIKMADFSGSPLKGEGFGALSSRF